MFLRLSLFFALFSLPALAQITIQFPTSGIVFQRTNQNSTKFYLSGTCPNDLDRIEAKLLPRSEGQGIATDWLSVEANPISGYYCGSITGEGGWYNLLVRGIKNGQPIGEVTTLEKVGIGEVFLIVGHSNAEGGASPSLGSNDERVNGIHFEQGSQMHTQYLQTADTTYLPNQYGQFCITCSLSPFGNPWYWTQLGDSLASKLNVPILFYGAAFGGSNMDLTYKSAYDIPFSHGFINYSIRMPYVNIRNTINKYVPMTGLRGILSSHGINDAGGTTEEFFNYSLGVIQKTRQEAQHEKLAWMVAISAYNNGVAQHIVNAQHRVIQEIPDTYQGPDLNIITNEGRVDNLHLNEDGQRLAAIYWSNAIINSNFLAQSEPMLAKPVRVYIPPSTLQSGNWNDTGIWCCEKVPKTSDEVFIKLGHTINIASPVQIRALHASGNLSIQQGGFIEMVNSPSH
jgi:hypothetical protein